MHVYKHIQNKAVAFDEGRQKLTSSLQEMGSLWEEFVRMKGTDIAVSDGGSTEDYAWVCHLFME